MPVKLTPRYMGHVARMHDNHPEHYAAEHAAFLKGTNLSEEGQQAIVDSNNPEIAHNADEIKRISSLPSEQHAAEVAKLHASEQSGPSNENSQTDAYLSNRGKIGKRETRPASNRKGG